MASDLENFIGAPDAEQRTPTPPPVGNTDSTPGIVSLYKDEPDPRPLNYAVSTAKQTTPDAAAQVLNLQNKTGMPADVIQRDPNAAEQVAASSGFDASQYQKDHPVVSDWIQESQHHASLAQNDIDNLGFTERLFGSIKNSYKQTQLSDERSSIGLAAMRGTITPEQRTRLDQINQELGLMPNYGMTGLEKIPGLLVNFATSKPTKVALLAGAASTIAGAPEAGLTLGYAGQTAMDTASNAYLDLESKGVDRKTALSLSAISGTVNGALMMAPIAKLTGIAPGLEWIQKMGMNKVLESPTVRNAIAKYGMKVVESSGVMGTVGGTSSLINSITEDIGELHKSGALQTMSRGALLSTFFRDENVQKAINAAEESALTGGAIETIGGGFGIPEEMRRVQDAKSKAAAFGEIGKTIANSETFQKAPQKTQEIIQRLTKDGPQENLFIPSETFNSYWQEKKVDPREAFESITGNPGEYDQAMRTGTDLRIPTDKYAVTIAPSEHNTFFQNEIRTSPNEMNAREADEYLKSEMGKATETAAPGPVEEATSKIKDDITSQLQTAGYDARTAGTYAQVYESAFGAMGQRAGVDPLELYQRYGLNIQRAEAAPDKGIVQSAIDKVRTLFQGAYHGTPHEFDQFSLKHIGTGQGAQSFGHGLYFAGNRKVAESYREQLAGGMVTKDFKVGDFHAVKNDVPQDYSPKNNSPYEQTRAVIMENLLIDQSGIDAAYSTGGEKAVKAHVLEAVNRQIKDYTQEGYTEGVEAAKKFRDSIEKQGVKMDAENQGRVYHVDIPEDSALLDWDNLIHEQPKGIQYALMNDKVISELFSKQNKEDDTLIDGLGIGDGKKRDGPALMTGQDLYEKLQKLKGSSVAASAHLNDLGIPGIKYLDAFSRGKKDGTSNYVIFDDKLVKILDRYHQGDRGFIQFGDQKVNISLLKDADLSTFLHESGHLYLNVLGDLAKAKDAPEQIKSDYQTILEHIGAKDGNIETEHHENFAKSFEQYLMEGKAPSENLRAPFQRFRSWLTSVYRNVKQLVTLKPEVRKVFDRLLATDEEINSAQAHQDMAPLFPDPKAYGMSDTQAVKYQKALQESHDYAEKQLMDKQMKEIRRTTEKQWTEERDRVREEISQEVDRQPEQLARAFLKNGKFPNGDALPEGTEFKLSRSAIEKDFKEFKLSELRGMYTADGGVHPDEVANAFGYKTGAELLNALKSSEDRNVLLDRMADQEMKNKYGDLMNHPKLAEAAMNAVHNTDRAKVLQLELQHLASENLPALKGMIRQMTRRIPRLEEVTEQANETIRDMQNRNIYPSLYLRQEARESRLAGEALAKGDVHGAFEAKQRELLNHELYRASSDWKTRQEKILNYFAKFDKDSTRERIAQGGRDGETYLEQIDALLDRFDIRKSTTLKELSQRQDLRTWLSKQRMDKGYDVEIENKFLDDTERTHWKNITSGDLDDLYGTIKTIDHLARENAEVLYEGRKQAFAGVVDTLNNSIRQFYKIGEKEPPNLSPTKSERFVRGVTQVAAEHFNPEFQFKELDGWEDNGPYWKAFFRPYKESQNNELLWRNQSLKAIEEITNEHYTPLERRALFDRIDTPEVSNKTITKNGLLAMAANHFNRYNLEGMLEGAKTWLTPGQLQKLMENHMTLKDWQFVQKTVDHVNSWWPMLAKLEKERNGIVPKKVEGDPFTIKTADEGGKTVFSTDGGYWPIKWDPEQDIAAKRLDTKETVEDMFGGSYSMAQTRQGHLKARSNTGGRPFSMDFFSVLSDHLANMQHDLAYRDFVINSKKLLNDPGVRHDISSVQGKEGFAQMDPWLRRIAGEKMGNAASKTEGLIGAARGNITIASLGYSLPTAAKHLLNTGFALREIGPKYFAKGFAEVWAKPWKMQETFNFIAQRDQEMANRQMFTDRDLREYWKGLPGLNSQMANLQKSYTMFMNGMDLATSMPVWLGAYRQAMEGHAQNIARGPHGEVNESDAIAHAASVVRMSKGSFAPGDLPKVMVGSPGYKLWTMFYGPMSIAGNNLNRVRGEFVQDRDIPKLIAGAALVWFGPAVGHEIISKGVTDDDKEHPIRNSLEAAALWPLETVMFARNIAETIKSARGSSDTPFSELLSNIGHVAKTGAQRILGDKDELTRSDITKAIDTAGSLSGIPTHKIWTSSETLYDWITGEYTPESVLSGMWDVAKGKKSE